MMFLRISIALFFLTLSFYTSFSQENVSVHLSGKDNGEPVAFSYVNVYSAAPRTLLYSAMTDTLGNASVTVNNFPVEIEIIALGYDKEILKLSSPPQNVLNFHLTQRFSSLNEVVVTGVAAPTKPQNALAVYKIINAEAIRAQGAVTLNEILNNQLNMSVGNDQMLGAGIRMQGLGGDKVKVLMDGVSVNGREGGNIDLGQINLSHVERVEVVQGPMSIIYGSDALGGVINVIEKKNRKPFELQATAHYESVGKYNVNLGAARSWKKHSIHIGGGRNYFSGWKYLDTVRYANGDSVLPRRNMRFKPKEQYIANAGYQYRSASGFRLGFATDFLQEKVVNKGMLNAYNAFRADAHDEYYFTNRSISRLSLEGKMGKGTWKIVNGFAYYKRVRKTVVTDLVTLDETLSTLSGVQDTSKFSDISSRGIYNNKFRLFELTAGYDIVLQQGFTKKISGDDHFINDYAAFALATVPFLKDERLKLQLGLRASYNTKFQAPLIPAVNILYNASEKIQLRASYAKGFRAPSLKELYLSFLDQNHEVLGNENLQSEVSDHLQFSISDMLYKKSGNYLQLLFTAYYNNVQEGIVLVPVHPEDPASIEYKYANQAKLRNTIGSLQIEGQQQNLHVAAGYSLNYTFGQETFSAFDAHEMNASLSYFWLRAKTNFNVFYKYTGAQPFLRSAIDGSVSYDGRQPEYHMLDASLERKFWKKKLSLTVGVKNILDVQTLQASGLSAGGAHSGNGNLFFLPRSFFSTLRFTFD